jgi:rRNA maturation protein Nop10
MTQIYCVKCKKFTNTKSEKSVKGNKGRYRLTGICSTCGTKKNMFLNDQGTFTRKTPDELDEARFSRYERTLKKKALAIGYDVLANEDAQKCVKKYISKKKESD